MSADGAWVAFDSSATDLTGVTDLNTATESDGVLKIQSTATDVALIALAGGAADLSTISGRIVGDDGLRAGVLVVAVVAGKAATKVQMLFYTLLLMPVALAPTLLGIAGGVYGISSVLLGLGFVSAAVAVLRSDADAPAKRMFGYSLFYLAGLFALLIVDGPVGLSR